MPFPWRRPADRILLFGVCFASHAILAVFHLLDQSSEQFEAWLAEHHLPKYRAQQVRRWLWAETVDGFEGMTDLAKPLRSQLAEEFS